jgi:hypothetical protein
MMILDGGGFHFLTVDVLLALLILIFLPNFEVIPKWSFSSSYQLSYTYGGK